MKRFLIILALLLCSFKPAMAASQFTTSYRVDYTLEAQGGSDVAMQISIKNNTAEYYAADFTLKIPDSGIRDIKVMRNKKELSTKNETKDGHIEVYVQFNDQVVGKGKSIDFTVTYHADKVGEIKGKNLEVIIPGLGKDYPGNYDLSVQVPRAFIGQHVRLQPEPSTQKLENEFATYTFTKDRLTEQTIIMNFGDTQTYDMSLLYYLNNTSSTTRARAEIALPPSTENQTVVYDSLEPKPRTIKLDPDGNYIAEYVLNPNQELEVHLKTKAIVSATMINNLPALTDTQLAEYLKPQEYWDTEAPEIKEIAAAHTTPKAIYDYVIKTLSYAKDRRDIASLRRQGSLQALKNPDQAVCMEFTDLFIAIARAAGIPAREVNGYGFTDEQEKTETLFADNFHAWPEYYDKQRQRWIQVDPTWEDTTGGVNYFSAFDTNHIVFVRRGISSTSPVGAGAYFKNESDKTVFVSYSDQDAAVRRDIKATLDDEVRLAGFPEKTSLQIENTGNIGYIGTIQSMFEPKDPLPGLVQPVHLPPFASSTIDYAFQIPWHAQNTIQATITDESAKPLVKGTIQINPLYLHPYTLLAAGYLLAITTILVLFKRFVKPHH